MRATGTFVILCAATLAGCATNRPAAVGPPTPAPASVAVSEASLAGSGDPAVQQLIARMEDEWGRAADKLDSATIGRMTAADYFSAASSRLALRGEILDEFGTPNPNLTQLGYFPDSAVTVRVYNDAAVVTAIGRSEARNNRNGVVFHLRSRYVETWVRRDGKWKVVAGAYLDAPLPKEILLAQLLEVEQQYSDMLNNRDSVVFNRLVSDSVTFATGTDSVEAKPQLWADIKESDIRTNVHQVDRAFVTADVGTVNGTIKRGLKDGTSMHIRYTNTWVYFGGHWRLIARQLVPS